MTTGAEINFGGAREVYLCEFERGTGARQICPSLDQMNKVKTRNSEGFSGRNQKFKRFFRPKAGDLQKQKGLHPKNVMKSGVSPQKLQKYRWQTPIWASICTPVAPSPLISSGHSLRLEGHNFRLGGHKQSFGGHCPEMPPPRGAGPVAKRCKAEVLLYNFLRVREFRHQNVLENISTDLATLVRTTNDKKVFAFKEPQFSPVLH